MYGPKGVGLLYKKEAVVLPSLLTGGGQERGLRGGTENVPAIVGFAEALKETTQMRDSEAVRLTELRELFFEKMSDIEGVTVNGSSTQRIANNINISVESVGVEIAIPFLDERHIYVSSGSACTARVPEPSHVIAALGKETLAKNSLRFTLGRDTTKLDVERAVEAVVELRKDH